MENVVTTAVALFFLIGFVFTIAGSLDPTGDPVGWFQDKYDAFRARFR